MADFAVVQSDEKLKSAVADEKSQPESAKLLESTTQKLGQLDSNDLISRKLSSLKCEYCGDSENEFEKTLETINVQGASFILCHRCHAATLPSVGGWAELDHRGSLVIRRREGGSILDPIPAAGRRKGDVDSDMDASDDRLAESDVINEFSVPQARKKPSKRPLDENRINIYARLSIYFIEVTREPNHSQRKQLAAASGLTLRQVSDWFSNCRRRNLDKKTGVYYMSRQTRENIRRFVDAKIYPAEYVKYVKLKPTN